MKVIDCRCRPDTPEFFALLDSPALRNCFRTTGNPKPEKPVSLAEFLQEVDKAGISQIVCTGRDMRSAGGAYISNDYVAGLVAEFPDRIIGLAGADPLTGDQAIRDIEYAIETLKLKGVSMDPALMEISAADPRLYPIYQKCSELNVPVFLTIGPIPTKMGKLKYADPLLIDEVAADFPKLKILCSHGGFPWTQQMVTIAWRHENVYFEPSVYFGLPGVVDILVEAANSIIGDRLCFGSAYPFAPMKDSLEKFSRLGFKDEVLPKVLYENARNLLGI
ncbi:amidohydrolase family protein [Desulfovibrio sp. OttesenSCG-928-C14]|nr:amidohydrolase family protein [Desulfovibrio sp. OttesenSCG-928-C14]